MQAESVGSSLPLSGAANVATSAIPNDGDLYEPHLSDTTVATMAAKNGRSTQVPSNPAAQPTDHWYHGDIAREHAEDILAGHNDLLQVGLGLFLVRKGIRIPGSFALTVLMEESLSHHVIKYSQGDGAFMLNEQTFFPAHCTTLPRALEYLKSPRSELNWEQHLDFFVHQTTLQMEPFKTPIAAELREEVALLHERLKVLSDFHAVVQQSGALQSASPHRYEACLQQAGAADPSGLARACLEATKKNLANLDSAKHVSRPARDSGEHHQAVYFHGRITQQQAS